MLYWGHEEVLVKGTGGMGIEVLVLYWGHEEGSSYNLQGLYSNQSHTHLGIAKDSITSCTAESSVHLKELTP